jgi:hypothetical protein
MNFSLEPKLDQIDDAYTVACYVAGMAKKAGREIPDFDTMNDILYYGYTHLVTQQNKKMNYLLSLDDYSKIVPLVYVSREEIQKYRETAYQEDETKEYILSQHVSEQDYDELMNSKDTNELFARFRIIEHEKDYHVNILHEIYFNKKLRDQDYENISCVYHFDDMNDPFGKYLDNLYSQKI